MSMDRQPNQADNLILEWLTETRPDRRSA